MRKLSVMALAITMALASCVMPGGTTTGTSAGNAGNILGGILGAITNGEAIGNVVRSILGFDKITRAQLAGSWYYDGPGCAFTSESTLAKAGGEVAATQIEEKLKAQYDKLGFNRSNTYIVFAEDGQFQAAVDGKKWSGTWTLDEQTGALNLKGVLLNLNGYVKGNGAGISVLFESKKLLTLVQTMSALSGNATAQTIGDLSKNYDGVRLGFDMSK